MYKNFFKKKIIQDGALYTASNAVVQVCSLIGVLFVARYLGPTNLGVYSFVQNYVAGFLTLLAGVDMYANWKIAKREDWLFELKHYIRQKIAVVSPLLLFSGAISYFLLPPDILRFVPFLAIPIITSIFASSVFIFQYQNKTKVVAFGTMLSSVLLLAAKLLAVATEQNLIVFVAINSLDGILLITLCTYYIFKNNSLKSTDKKPLELLKLLFDARYSVFFILFWFIVTRADQFFVPVYFDAYSLGIYSSAVKVIEMTNVLIVILQGVILPRMSYIKSEIGTSRRMHMTIGLYAGVGTAAAIAVQLLAPLVVNLLFGPSFTESVSVLRVYAWSIPGLFVSYLFTVVAMSNDTIKTLALHSVLFAGITLSALMTVTSFHSILYIAWVSVGVYTLSAGTLYIMWRKKYL